MCIVCVLCCDVGGFRVGSVLFLGGAVPCRKVSQLRLRTVTGKVASNNFQVIDEFTKPRGKISV